MGEKKEQLTGGDSGAMKGERGKSKEEGSTREKGKVWGKASRGAERVRRTSE